MDLFGPPTHASLGRKKYCLVIIDDYSRYTWVYFFKHKYETQQIVKHFTNEVQRQYGQDILMIQSDNGTKFKNYTLNDFLSDEGIHHQYLSPYSPQQNGVVERKNQTLMDMARTMLAEFKSLYNFWAEAINTTCHATNQLYLCKGLNKTLYEILTGNKPNIKYFWVFGYKCFYLKKGVHLSKFDSKPLEGIFVGYATESHVFRIFDKKLARIIEVSNMGFDENDSSHVEQSGVCDVGDEIPPQAIRRMGVGHLIPIEEHLLAEGEGLCSTQVELSPSQGLIDANQRQALDPHPSKQGQDQDQVNGGKSSPTVNQGQAQDNEHAHVDEQAQVESQDEDQNSGHDQVVSQETLEEAQARRERKVKDVLRKGSHTMDVVIGSVRKWVSTRRQLANFSSHHAFIFRIPY
jgi:hypothetical protein